VVESELFRWRRVRGREESDVFVGLDGKTSGRSRSEEGDGFQKRKASNLR